MKLTSLRPEFHFFLQQTERYPYVPGEVAAFSIGGVDPAGKSQSAACSTLLGVLHTAHQLTLDSARISYSIADEQGDYNPRQAASMPLRDAFTSDAELAATIEHIYQTIHLGREPAELTL